MKIFLCGDVMTGRGIDQALPHPCSPILHEGYLNSAVDYLRLAEQAHGPVPRPVDFAYVWGADLAEWLSAQPHARIVNLETSITRATYRAKGHQLPHESREHPMPEHGGHRLLRAGQQPCSRLGPGRPHRTLNALREGESRPPARAAISRRPTRQPSSSSPAGAGSRLRAGVRNERHPPGLGGRCREARGQSAILSFRCDRRPIVEELAESGGRGRRRRLHPLGAELGLSVPTDQRRFAHGLIEGAGVSIVHGHSSHHAKAIEVYRLVSSFTAAAIS